MKISIKFLISIISISILFILAGCGCGKNHEVAITLTPGQYKYQDIPKDDNKKENIAYSHKIIPADRFFSNNHFKKHDTVFTVPLFKDYYNQIKENAIKSSYTFMNDLSCDFIKWINDNYNKHILSELSKTIKSSSYTEQFWDDKTGCTLNVLKDYYTKTLSDNDQSNAKNNIYTKNAADKDSVNISFAGDLCLSEGWYTLNKYDESDKNIEQCISKELIDKTNKADIFCLNNEFTFSNRGAPLNGKLYTFRASPVRIEILKSLGVDTVSLSNNHVYDYGVDAFNDTMATLNDNNIPYFGAGKNINEACQPVYYVINGMKIAFVGASRAEKVRYTPAATASSPGILLAYDYKAYLDVIKKASENSDYVIAYIHWGTEDSHSVTDYQKTMGKAFIDAGADAVIGGHPHVLQGIEFYNNKPIVYSLGDFWFNYETKETGIINLKIDNTGLKELSFIPCMQSDFKTTLQTGTEASRIFNYLKELSFNVNIDDSGIITPTEN